jgi:DNA-binding CsgD family transcriptional regulator/tetratricopeptide (TPR) repeat protein
MPLNSTSMPTTVIPSPGPPGPGPGSRVVALPPRSVDTWGMRSRLTSSHFVGRAGELAELQRAFDEAASGRPGLVLLGGDSGVGKTRLVSEFEQRLTLLSEEGAPGSGGVIFLRGQSLEQSDGDLPYAPLLGALRPVVRGRHEALEELSAGDRSQLATILPGLEEDGRERDQRPDPSGQLRLFEAILELLEILAECEPVVLALEDVHWADRSTRAFIAFAARSMRQTRVLLLLSYRADELHRRHPLRPLLSELERLDRARRIDLQPFDRDELSEALTDILGSAPNGSLLNRLFARSEGNPLYTEELLAAGTDGRGAAPQSLRDAFIARIEELSPDAQRIARVVSVGRVLDEATLAAVTGMEVDAVQAALRDAVSEQVLISCDVTGFGFRHALLREALHDDLLPGERSELHLALAHRLELDCGIDDEQELERKTAIAGHYAAAGEQPAALRSTIAAAQAAQRVFAFGEAADLSDRALELWPRVQDPEQVAGVSHVDLLQIGSRAHGDAGKRTRAESLLREALRELGPSADPGRYAYLLARLSRTIWMLNQGAEALAAGERALAILPADEPVGVRPLILAWLARMRLLRGNFQDAVADGERALELAVAAGDRESESNLLNTLGMAKAHLQELDEGVALLRRAIEVAVEAEDLDGISVAYANLADMLGLAGRNGEALDVAYEGLERLPRRFARRQDWLQLTVSEQAFECGEWNVAREALARTPALIMGLMQIYRALCEAELELGVGDEEAAEQLLDTIAEEIAITTEPQWIGAYGALRAELHARRGELDDARRYVEQGLGRLEVCTDDAIRIARLSASAVAVEADRAQRARDLRDTAGRRDALARGRLHMDRLEAAVTAGGSVEQARLAQAKAEMARARGRGSARDWAKAADAWESIGRPYQVAQARWRQAECEIAAGKREPAAQSAAVALAGAERLGSRWLADEVRTLIGRARLDAVGARAVGDANGNGTGPDPGRATVPDDPFGLTPRERQVLQLVSQGATNRQIGQALYMAEKTASVHVSRILSKLDVQGRTEAAAVAHRLHLT